MCIESSITLFFLSTFVDKSFFDKVTIAQGTTSLNKRYQKALSVTSTVYTIKTTHSLVNKNKSTSNKLICRPTTFISPYSLNHRISTRHKKSIFSLFSERLTFHPRSLTRQIPSSRSALAWNFSIGESSQRSRKSAEAERYVGKIIGELSRPRRAHGSRNSNRRSRAVGVE